jgi:hypothetical protein
MNWYWAAGAAYAVIAVIFAVLFIRDSAKAEYNDPSEDIPVAILLGLIWPFTCLMFVNMWKDDRRSKKRVSHKQECRQR